jgi:hypothetical protein
MNYSLQYRSWFKSNLFILLAVPVVVLSMIYISYGKIIEAFLLAHPDIVKLYQLQTQINIFASRLDLPIHVKALGYYSTIFIYILFFGWLVSHGYQSYKKLSHREGSKAAMLLETITILSIYILIISPGLLIWISLIGYCLITAIIVIIIFYWIYAIKSE